MNSCYQQASKLLFTFVLSKKFYNLITNSHYSFLIPKNIKVELQSFHLWFTDQNNTPLAIQDSINITLTIG